MVQESEMVQEAKLSPEDQERVDKVISSGVNVSERQPFHFWWLMLVIMIALGILGGLSFWIGRLAGSV